MKRRNFFKRLTQAAVVIALAPRLAFRVPSEIISAPINPAPSEEFQRAFVDSFFFNKPFPKHLLHNLELL